MKKLILLAIALAAQPISQSSASDSAAGYISSITPNRGGMTYFNQDGTRTTKPACATYNRWVIDSSTAGGDALLATILTAYAMKKKVTVAGTGVCNDNPDTEGVFFIVVID